MLWSYHHSRPVFFWEQCSIKGHLPGFQGMIFVVKITGILVYADHFTKRKCKKRILHRIHFGMIWLRIRKRKWQSWKIWKIAMKAWQIYLGQNAIRRDDSWLWGCALAGFHVRTCGGPSWYESWQLRMPQICPGVVSALLKTFEIQIKIHTKQKEESQYIHISSTAIFSTCAVWSPIFSTCCLFENMRDTAAWPIRGSTWLFGERNCACPLWKSEGHIGQNRTFEINQKIKTHTQPLCIHALTPTNIIYK